jgi:hypothetical protein
MIWIFFIGLQAYILISGIRQQGRDGTWSWPMFAFAMGFVVFECLILTLPLRLGMNGSRYFVPVWTAAWIIAALNFLWFLAVCRRWKPKPRNR